MFKLTPYSDLQKRKKMVIGMHLVDPSDRYHYFNLVGGNNQLMQKTSSITQLNKQEHLTQRQMLTLPVTPNNKQPSFLEQTQSLVSKQVSITPRLKLVKQQTKPLLKQLQGQLIDKKRNESFKGKATIPNLSQKKIIGLKKQILFELVQPSEFDDFVDYVCNKKLI
ncbi:unnamed protein product (macronuclear) [Paramecium tetraurelia]|uniref:Uncharacterized protein n=1 Tax=Paramecium tetraurelia TaxID=5888 RepID=A0DXV4_PARTE|nr:uncharacterized protein GSPATT00021495001 [Paramecium tetraurelia]CAK87871.1 unnamed protein product [Paramecium tetraurelia]|eukprot:XP_001455268.1 hypothetical protein (macronuclear) [Paramecium tetraurelia strain d4-2]